MNKSCKFVSIGTALGGKKSSAMNSLLLLTSAQWSLVFCTLNSSLAASIRLNALPLGIYMPSSMLGSATLSAYLVNATFSLVGKGDLAASSVMFVMPSFNCILVRNS